MFKSFFLSLLVLSSAFALDVAKCGKCAISKEYIKCSVYVEKKGDKSRQKSCQVYAESLYAGNSEARATWYFLLSGSFDQAINAGEKGLLLGKYYVAEQIAEAYLLKGDKENAKKYSKILKEHIHENIFLEKHIAVLSRLYPDKFDANEAEKLLK